MTAQSKPEPTTLFYMLHKLTQGLTYDKESCQFKGTVTIDGQKFPVALSKELLFSPNILESCLEGDFEEFYTKFRLTLATLAIDNEEKRLNTTESEKLSFTNPALGEDWEDK